VTAEPPPPAAPAGTPAVPGALGALRRRMAVVAAALVVIAVVVGALVFGLPKARPVGAAPHPTTWAAITSKIRNGAPSKQVALEAFAYEYGITIPGVHLPAGTSAADDAPQTGTAAVRWVQSNWSQLSPDQQAVIAPYLSAQPGDTVVTYDLTAAAASARAPRPAEIAHLDVAPPGHTTGQRGRAAAATPGPTLPSDAFQAAFKAEVLADIARIGPKLGLPTMSEGFGLWTNVTVRFSQLDGGKTLLQTLATVNKAGIYSPCDITIFRNTWQGETLTNGAVSDLLHVLATHEVVHCYQNTIWGSVDTALAIPDWITEGTAMWLAADDTRKIEVMVPLAWRQLYFGWPEEALTNRTYDAYGYYALLDHLGRNLWASLVPAWRAAAAGGGNRSDAFIAQLQGDAEDVRDTWAPSYARESGWGDPWVAYGFGLPDDAQAPRHPIAAVSAPGYLGSLDSRSNTLLSVQEGAGEIVAIQTDGLASVRDDAGHAALAFQSKAFCVTDAPCICPPNTERAGEHIADDQLRFPFTLAVNAGSGGAQYRVLGRTLEEACGPKQDDSYPRPGGGGAGGGGGSGGQGDSTCGTGCAGSNGDPHLRTVDNVYYDFQATGEYTLLRSADGSLEVQARQEPYAGSDHVSINTALAAKVGAHRVGLYSTDSGLTARVDGTPTDASTPVDLGDGAELSRHPRGFELTFADGTSLWALSLGQWGINVQIRPSPGLRSNGVGLLGVVLPGGLGVPALPDGTRLARTTDRAERYRDVYDRLAAGWRVTQATSLFDYDGGTSSASYQTAGFPNPVSVLAPGDLSTDQRAAAAAACAGVTDLGLLEQCLYDVTVTADPGFGGQYVATNVLVDQGPATLDVPISGEPSPAPSSGPVGTPGPRPSTAPIAGAAVTGYRNLLGSAVGPDSILYVSLGFANDRYEIDAIDPATSQVLRKTDAKGGGALIAAFGSLWAGEFAGGTDCSITRLDPQTFAVQATIPTECNFFHTAMAATSEGVYVLDRTLQGSTAEGIRQIDPATNAVSDPVVVPFFNGFLSGTPDGVVYGDDDGWSWLANGSTQLVSLGAHPSPVFAGSRGVWTTEDQVARLFVADGPAVRTITIDGSVVAADADAIYVNQFSRDGGPDELWRYPIDGGDPARVAVAAPQLGSTSFSYRDNDPIIVTDTGLAKLWQVPDTDTSSLFVQWTPAVP
jgi:hypothetical protein